MFRSVAILKSACRRVAASPIPSMGMGMRRTYHITPRVAEEAAAAVTAPAEDEEEPSLFNYLGDDVVIPDNVKAVAESVLMLNIQEMNMFLHVIQQRLNVPTEAMTELMKGGGGGGSGPAAAAVEEEPVKEQTEFGVKLTVVDAGVKIKVIKEVRTITGLGLKEAKELVEKAPVNLKEGLPKEEAMALLKVLTDVGASAELF